MAETEATAVVAPTIEDWTQTPWRKLERYVYRLQKRIYKAQARGNVKAVHSLQRLLMKSRAARMLAVRRVTQDNHGKKTAGVDGVKAVGPMVRLLFVAQLRTPDTIAAQPVRRVLIPKPGKNEKRKLGIPVMLDRAHQALAKLAVEPQWEARFEPHSYGFRPGRSTHDAIEAIFTVIAQQGCYALDADIKGCFDGISHRALLNKLDTTPALYRAVKAWLRAGVLHDGVFTSSTSGTPQGGVASPLLANIALHGLETCASQAYRRPGAKGDATRPRLIRYADDFVILCPNLDGITAARQAVEQFLDSLDLHLSLGLHGPPVCTWQPPLREKLAGGTTRIQDAHQTKQRRHHAAYQTSGRNGPTFDAGPSGGTHRSAQSHYSRLGQLLSNRRRCSDVPPRRQSGVLAATLVGHPSAPPEGPTLDYSALLEPLSRSEVGLRGQARWGNCVPSTTPH
jgi:group II intron reverse transcriptase/maturase